MPRFSSGGRYSSRDPSCETLCVRLPGELALAVRDACAQQGISVSEFLRELVNSWCYGKSQLQAPSDGYRQARAMATQLAVVAMSQAIENFPEEPTEAARMLAEYHAARRSR